MSACKHCLSFLQLCDERTRPPIIEQVRQLRIFLDKPGLFHPIHYNHSTIDVLRGHLVLLRLIDRLAYG